MKLKAEVRINDYEGASDLDLTLSSEQSVRLLECVARGGQVHINLLTGQSNGHVREDPKAYAQP